jgi:hypothetical protein
MKVRVGKRYRYEPVLLDRIHPPYDVHPGDVVRVVHLPGCPRAGTATWSTSTAGSPGSCRRRASWR